MNTFYISCRVRIQDGIAAVRSFVKRIKDAIRADLLIDHPDLSRPIETKVGLYAVRTTIAGWIYFTLTISAPQNRSRYIKDLVNAVAYKMQPYLYNPVLIKEAV